MKKKLVFTIVGVFIFLTCFAASVRIYDYFYEQKLRQNIHKIKVGMSAQEVIQILGEPTEIQMSDGPYYWCYSTNSFDWFLYPTESGLRPTHMLLEMGSAYGHVSKVFDFYN